MLFFLKALKFFSFQCAQSTQRITASDLSDPNGRRPKRFRYTRKRVVQAIIPTAENIAPEFPCSMTGKGKKSVKVEFRGSAHVRATGECAGAGRFAALFSTWNTYSDILIIQCRLSLFWTGLFSCYSRYITKYMIDLYS